MELTKKGELLGFRAELEKQIKWLNEKQINDSYDGISREVAVEVRKKLIEANNIINEYRLRGL